MNASRGGEQTALVSEQWVYIKYEISTSVGCGHYIRGCHKRCETCKKFYPCRICHDDAEDHTFPRYETTTVKCNYCHKEQAFSQYCNACGELFGQYICYKCKLIDGMGSDAKPVFHCDGCGICRVGLRHCNTHCPVCRQCYLAWRFNQHACCELTEDCCVCLGSLRHCNYQVITLGCMHQMHVHCYSQLVDAGTLSCPICKKSMLTDVTKELIKKHYTDVIRTHLLPRTCRHTFYRVMCNDCYKVLILRCNVAYYCYRCRTYNCQIIEEVPCSKLVRGLTKLIEVSHGYTQYRYMCLKDLKAVLEEKFQYPVKQIQRKTGRSILLHFSKYCAAVNAKPETIEYLTALLCGKYE